MQFLFNIAVDNLIMEKYLQQPVKNVLLYILNATTRRTTRAIQSNIEGKRMPVVSETLHMGILRSNDTHESAVRKKYDKGTAYLV